jgi:tRNA G37 N-methylase Trm5
MTWVEHIGPFLLGVYESELDGAWTVALEREYSQIIDVGAKFGYYAVGLARRYPATPVVAFDIDRWARAALHDMSAANGTSNLTVRSYCDQNWMTHHLAKGALVVSDCEGFEDVLFPHDGLDAFREATLIIETHDEAAPGVTERIRRDFTATHQVTVIDQHAPRRTAERSLDFLTSEQRAQAISEIRQPTSWLFARPRTRPAQ